MMHLLVKDCLVKLEYQAPPAAKWGGVPAGRVVMSDVVPLHCQCSRASALAGIYDSAAAFVVVAPTRAIAAALIVHLDVGAH